MASVSKQFTATAILMLEREGLLSLDDVIGTYVDGLPAWGQTTTLEQLLHHTSHIRDFWKRAPGRRARVRRLRQPRGHRARDRADAHPRAGHRVSLLQRELRAARRGREAGDGRSSAGSSSTRASSPRSTSTWRSVPTSRPRMSRSRTTTSTSARIRAGRPTATARSSRRPPNSPAGATSTGRARSSPSDFDDDAVVMPDGASYAAGIELQNRRVTSSRRPARRTRHDLPDLPRPLDNARRSCATATSRPAGRSPTPSTRSGSEDPASALLRRRAAPTPFPEEARSAVTKGPRSSVDRPLRWSPSHPVNPPPNAKSARLGAFPLVASRGIRTPEC